MSINKQDLHFQFFCRIGREVQSNSASEKNEGLETASLLQFPQQSLVDALRQNIKRVYCKTSTYEATSGLW